MVLIVIIVVNLILCFGGNIIVIVMGSGGMLLGLGSYVYNWSNGNINSIIIGLIVGVYCVMVIDVNVCIYVVCVIIM